MNTLGPYGDHRESPIKASNIIYLHQLGTVGTVSTTELLDKLDIDGDIDSHARYRKVWSLSPHSPQTYIAAHKRNHSDYVR